MTFCKNSPTFRFSRFRFKLPIKPATNLAICSALAIVGLALIFLGHYRGTEATMISGTMLGFFTVIFYPLIWLHITSYPRQVFQHEWLYIAVSVVPHLVWLYALLFAHIGDGKVMFLMLPALPFVIATLTPSPKHLPERQPAWRTAGR